MAVSAVRARAWRSRLGLALLAINLVLANLLAARWYARFDWSPGRVFSLSQRTLVALSELRRPVRFLVFMLPPERYQESLYAETLELCRGLAGHSPWISVETLDIDADPAQAEVLAKKHDVSAADLQEGVLVVESGGRSKVIGARSMAEYQVTPEGRRMVAFRGEECVLEAMLELTGEEPATVCFLQGHGEAPIDSYGEAGYGRIVDEVKRDGLRARAVQSGDLLSGLSGCRVLALGGPCRAFAEVELDALDRYLRRGGRMLVLLGPVLDRQVTRYGRIGLEQWLARWGLEPRQNTVVDPLAVPGERPLLTWATRESNADHPIGRAMAGRLTVWPLAREVRPVSGARQGLSAVPLVRTSASGWAESDLSSLRGDAPLRLDPEADTPGPVTVAAAAEWRGARLVVLGTERGVLNQRLGRRTLHDDNRDLFLASLSWLAASGQRSSVTIGPKRPEHVRLILDERQLTRVFLICVVAMPLSAVFLGLLVWWRRRT